METETGAITHVTFGTKEFRQAIGLLKRTASRYGVKDVRIYGPEHGAIMKLAREQPGIMSQRRGAGYWLWKPTILLHAMASLPDGAIVIYTDAGVAYDASPSPLVQLLRTEDVITFSNFPTHLQRIWTKRDCFILLGADRQEEWERRQLDAAVLLIRNSARARELLTEWGAAMADPRVLTDQPNECGLPNLDGFIEHRHDQSVLTIVAARNAVPVLPMPMHRRSKQMPYGAIFLQHRMRDDVPRSEWLRLANRLRVAPWV